MRQYYSHLFLLLLMACGLGNAALAEPAKETSGKIRIYSRTSQNGQDQKKKDTFILWSDSTTLPEEDFDTVVVISGKVNFHGRAKDLVILGGEVTLHDDAHIDGSLTVLGGKLHKHEGAKVSEQVLFELPSHLPRWIGTIGPLISFIYSDVTAFLYVMVRAVFICLFGAMFYMWAPELMREAELYTQSNPLRSLGWTFLGILLFVPGIVMLLISLVGITFIPAYLMAYGVIYYFFGYVMVANILGHNLPPRDSIVMPPLRFFYGVFILTLISYVPFVGTALIRIAMCFTAGAMFHTLVGRIRSRSAKPAKI